MKAGSETAETAESVDGRVRRGERNRTAIVDALLALIEEGACRPTARDIATRAGVSLRSVFQHFDDLEALYAALADRQTERIAALMEPVPRAGSTAERVAWLVDQRARVYERIAPVRRATIAAAWKSPELERRLALAARWARDHVEQTFAPELAAADTAQDAADLRAALDAVSCWEAWDHLRRAQGLSVAAARRVMAAMLTAVLTGPHARVE